MARNLKSRSEDEPLLEGEEWVEWGGELVWAAGSTSGGAPYGLSVDEYRRCSMAATPRVGWARSRQILERIFRTGREEDVRVEVGWVKFVGDGLYRKAYAAHVELAPDRDAESGRYVVLLPKPDVEPDFTARVRREATILHRLGRMALPFRVPRVVGVMPVEGKPALIEEFVEGFPLDLRAGRQRRLKPWEVVGRLAAGVHALDCRALDPVLEGYATRREHGESCLSIFDGLDEPPIRDARDWARSHLPPAAPASLLHGDLLGQNIVHGLDDPLASEASLTLIDWEFARRGDPAYDLAVVTRGVRRPFQISGGLEKLLAAYAGAGGSTISVPQVWFHELCLAVGWYREALEQRYRTAPPEHYLKQLRAVLRRASESD